MDKQLHEALKTIHEHCESHDRCDGCPLNIDREYGCYIGSLELNPENWDLEEFETN